MTGIGLSNSEREELRTKLSGNIIIGPSWAPLWDHPTESTMFSTGPRSSLIHNVADQNGVISIFCAYPRVLESVHVSHTSSDDSPFVRTAFVSSASLDNVANVQIFNDERVGLCRGIIIEYKNGLERALGQCRIGLDAMQSLAQPSHICFANVTYYRPNTEFQLLGVRVESTTKPMHEHNGMDWKCHAMESMLEFWLTKDKAKLEIPENDW